MHQINATTTLIMKQFYIIILTLLFFSCGKDKSVLLPEIENANITEILDVSPAYLFYDETQPDSLELNRKNLIGTTNWLFNVDKRLTLEQAIPKIKFLQDKKRNAQMHKNENAKNFYTCNDTSIQNLGFIEFTDVVYQSSTVSEFCENNDCLESSVILTLETMKSFYIEKLSSQNNIAIEFNDFDSLKTEVFSLHNKYKEIKLYLKFNSELNFQHYITLKSTIDGMFANRIDIDYNEFIY